MLAYRLAVIKVNTAGTHGYATDTLSWLARPPQAPVHRACHKPSSYSGFKAVHYIWPGLQTLL